MHPFGEGVVVEQRGRQWRGPRKSTSAISHREQRLCFWARLFWVQILILLLLGGRRWRVIPCVSLGFLCNPMTMEGCNLGHDQFYPLGSVRYHTIGKSPQGFAPRRAQASRGQVTVDLHPAPTPFCSSEEVNALMELTGASGASSEKESKRTRDEPERVMKQWERDPTESERDTTDDEGLKQVPQRPEERDRKGSEELTRKLLGDSRSPKEITRRESMDVYRRLSEDSDHTGSDNVSLSEKKMVDVARGEVERLEKTEEEDETKN